MNPICCRPRDLLENKDWNTHEASWALKTVQHNKSIIISHPFRPQLYCCASEPHFQEAGQERRIAHEVDMSHLLDGTHSWLCRIGHRANSPFFIVGLISCSSLELARQEYSVVVVRGGEGGRNNRISTTKEPQEKGGATIFWNLFNHLLAITTSEST